MSNVYISCFTLLCSITVGLHDTKKSIALRQKRIDFSANYLSFIEDSNKLSLIEGQFVK